MTSLPSFLCSHHPKEILTRVDPGLNARKALYCIECIFEDTNPKNFFSKLQNFSDYTKTLADTFLTNKDKLTLGQEPFPEFIEALSQEEEAYVILEEEIDREKSKIEEAFAQLEEDLIEVLNKKRDEKLSILDSQLALLREKYSAFKRQIKMCFPHSEEIESLYPSLDVLKRSLSSTVSVYTLEKLITDYKQSLNEQEKAIDLKNQEDDIRSMVNKLKELQYLKPEYHIKVVNREKFKGEIDQHLSLALQGSFLTQNDKINHYDLQSSIITAKDINFIVECLPKQYTFSTQLLYQGSRDGLNATAFHARCDGKGPTITFTKCQIGESSEVTVIGGFLDQDWHKRNIYITSDESFVFSLTSQVKCELRDSRYAAFGGGSYGPTFGSGSVINVSGDENEFSETYVYPAKSYTNSQKLLGSEVYKENFKYYFKMLDIETFAVTRS